jgi:hypothetical protein
MRVKDEKCKKGCPGKSQCGDRAKIHGIRKHETCAEADERRRIAYRIARRASVVSSSERTALAFVFAIDGGTRRTVAEAAAALGFSTEDMAKRVRDALKKIGWTKPVDLSA